MKNFKFSLRSLIGCFAILFLTAFVFNPPAASAQIVKSQTVLDPSGAINSVLTAPDTAFATYSVDNSVKSFRGFVTKTSGTVAGKLYFQGSYGDGYWDTLDSLTLTNVTIQYKTFSPGVPLIYASYRIQYITSGTSVCTAGAYYLRRN